MIFNRLFKKNEPDLHAMAAFWQWFVQEQAWIQKNSGSSREVSVGEFIQTIDRRLTPCFPYFPAEKIQFQLGFNNGRGEFFFFDLKNKNLHRDALVMAQMMPEELKKTWNFIIEN